MIEPVFEEIAHQKTHGRDGGRPAFVKVDMAVGMGGQVGAEWGVRVTPTFLFFLDGKKVSGLLVRGVVCARADVFIGRHTS